MGNCLLLRLVQIKNRSEKFPFIAANNWILLAVWWSTKHFFVPNSPIHRISLAEEGESGNLKALCFTSKCNKKSQGLQAFALYELFSLKFHESKFLVNCYHWLRKFYVWDGMSTIKCLLWNTNDSCKKLMVSITNGVSLWYRPCYKNMLNCDNSNKCQKVTTIKIFFDCRADTGFSLQH